VLSSRRRAIFPKWAFKKGSFLEPQNRRIDAQVQSLSKTGGARCEKNLFSIFVKIVLSSTRDAHFHKKTPSFFGRGLKAWFGQLRKWAPLCGDMRTFVRAQKSPQNWSRTKKLKKHATVKICRPCAAIRPLWPERRPFSGHVGNLTKMPMLENSTPLRRYAHFSWSAQNRHIAHQQKMIQKSPETPNSNQSPLEASPRSLGDAKNDPRRSPEVPK
jgi:hypothetical protein